MAIALADIVQGNAPPTQALSQNENAPQNFLQIGFWQSPLFAESRQVFLKLKKIFYIIADVASYCFWGLRAVADVIDPAKTFFSKKFSHILFCTCSFDFLLQPFNVVSAVKDVIALFSPKSLAEEIETILLLIRDGKTVVRDWATLLTILNTVKVVSRRAVRWVGKFNVASFFVDFINIEKDCYYIKRSYALLKKFEFDQATLHAHRLLKVRAQVATEILQRIEVEKGDLAFELDLSKKAIHARVAELSHAILCRNKKKKSKSLREVNDFLKILARRAKVETGLNVIDLVNSVVYSAGSFIWFFPRFYIPSTFISGATGVVSVLLWASSKIALKKNPF